MKYKLNVKAFLAQANWSNEDFPATARLFARGDWYVTDEMLENVVEEGYQSKEII